MLFTTSPYVLMANHIKSIKKKNLPGEKSNKNTKILKNTQTVFYLKGGKTVLLKKPGRNTRGLSPER